MPPATNCPDCGVGLVLLKSGPPWCPECEWNLGAFHQPDNPYLPKRFIRSARRDHRRAFRRDRRLFQDITGSKTARPGWTPRRIAVTAISVALLLSTVLTLGYGLYLLAQFPSLPFLLGLLLVLVGIELRPRIPRIDLTYGTLSPAEAPATFAVIEQVANRLGAQVPAVLCVDETFNAACARSGLRRQPVLVIGLSLWGGLSSDGRVALLGHELGHLVNNDPRSGLLTQPALTTFYRLADLFNPHGMLRSGLAWLIGRVVFLPLTWVCLRIHLALCRLAADDSRRAEYLADDLALRIGGTAGATELIRTLVAGDAVYTAVRRAATSGAPVPDWVPAAAEARQRASGNLRFREQRSIRREASTLASHPPAGLRSRMLATRTEQQPALTVEPQLWLDSDAELAPHYERARRALANL